MMNFLKRLCSNGFSEDAFKTLCTRKWSSFAFAPVPLPDDADFVAPKLFGFVKNLPASTQNAGLQLAVPIVVARLPDGRELGERSSRKRQFDFAKKTLAAISDSGRAGGVVLGGLFAFYDAGGNFRLSLVSGTPDAATHKLRYNSFRRQSFYVRKGGADCRTFIERLAMPADSFAALREIFSVEKLTKEFYAQVEAWFLWARERVSFPGAAELGKDELTHNSDMALRLITRLIFIWFLRAKKLVPEELFDKRKIDELLKYDDANRSTYYKAILQNLFFATLNTKGTERGWVERRAGKQEYFRYKRFFKNDAKSEYLSDICANVPFVNGGLFENLDRAGVRIDCFSNRKDNEDRLSVPDELFFAPEDSVEITLKDKDGKLTKKKTGGILNLLSRYNFTVEENAPADEDVSLDPELLGRVFENLLAFVNPETHEQARKATGSFYTPREIVRYMVDESLIACLTEKCGAENSDVIRALVSDSVRPASDDAKRKIVAALDGVKILDPACGSGAFPMGALARIIEIHEALGALDPADGEAVYKKKLDVIQNCLYGVDIQSIAVQISKLRFFISLLCEQKVDRERENLGISVLPNLESKIVCANTLVALPQKLDGGNAFGSELALEGETRTQPELALGDVDEIRALRERLKTSRKNYFAASSKQDKARLREEDKKLRAELAKKMLANAGHADAKFRKSVELVASWNPYDPNTSAPFFDPVWMFGFDRPDAFDIVIGNPPYISAPDQVKNPKLAIQREYLASCGNYKTLCQKWDLYIPFMELGMKLLASAGAMSMIVPFPLTNQTYGKKFRQWSLAEYDVFELVDLNGTKIFENATVSNVIFFAARKPSAGTTMISKIDADRQIFKAFPQPYEKLVQSEKTAVWNLTQEERSEKRFEHFPVLGDFCYLSVGMVLNADEKTAKGEFSKDDLISETPDRIHCRKYIEAKDIERYRVKRERWLEYGTKRCPGKLRRPTFPELYEKKRILINGFGVIQATWDGTKNYLHNSTIYAAVKWNDFSGLENKSITASVKKYGKKTREEMEELSKKIELKFLLGILNSTFSLFLLNSIRGGDFHILPGHLRNIPVPSATREQQAPIVALVDRILEAKRGNADADTSAWEAEIDRLVYALYGLTAEEIALVENQRDAGVPSAAPETGTPVSASSQQQQEGSAPRAGAYDPALDD